MPPAVARKIIPAMRFTILVAINEYRHENVLPEIPIGKYSWALRLLGQSTKLDGDRRASN